MTVRCNSGALAARGLLFCTVLGLADHGLRPGAHADLLALEAGSVPQAIVERPSPTLVIRRGRIVREETAAPLSPSPPGGTR